MTTSVEAWKPVVGYEGLYEVSDQGRVRSLDRVVLVRRRDKVHSKPLRGRVLRPASKDGEYLCVNLCKDCRTKTFAVHALVLTAFNGIKPEGRECCHWNGNPADNRLENLRWDTPKANGEDRARLGRYRGESRVNAKLNEEKVLAVKQSLSSGISQRRIAQQFGVSRSAIQSIAENRSWAWLIAPAP